MLGKLYDEMKQRTPSFKCVVAQWADSLSDEDREAYNISMNDDDLSSRSLFDLYKSVGAKFGLTSLKEHRNGTCTCR
jgi:hypothetical protein